MRLNKRFLSVAIAGAVLLMTAPAFAQTAQTSAAASQADAVDPAAIAALKQMGTTLRGLKQFSITSDTTSEVVLDSGQKIQMDGQAAWKVRPPSHMYLEVKSDRRQRQYFYDGKGLTIYAPQLDYYAVVDGINASLPEFAQRASDDYGIELPLTDLFLWGTDKAPISAIKAATEIGPGEIDGDRVEHYAFRQDGVDWQVWISQATFLPRKLVITNLGDAAQPQYTARLKWNTGGAIPDSAFTFAAPKTAHKIEFVPMAAATGEK